jgi:hypothetical protein
MPTCVGFGTPHKGVPRDDDEPYRVTVTRATSDPSGRIR